MFDFSLMKNSRQSHTLWFGLCLALALLHPASATNWTRVNNELNRRIESVLNQGAFAPLLDNSRNARLLRDDPKFARFFIQTSNGVSINVSAFVEMGKVTPADQRFANPTLLVESDLGVPNR